MTGESRQDNAFRRAARGVFWGGLAMVSATIAFELVRTEEGMKRIAEAPAEAARLATAVNELRNGDFGPVAIASRVEPAPARENARVPQMQSDLAAVRATAETLAQRQAATASRLAALEEQLQSITGSIQRQNHGNIAAERVSMFAPNIGAPQAGQFEVAPIGTIVETPEKADGAGSRVIRTEFAVAMTTASDIPSIEQAWRDLNREFPSELQGLAPFVSIEKGAAGTKLTLLAGPLRNAGDAARVCVALSVSGKPCRAAAMSGSVMPLSAN